MPRTTGTTIASAFSQIQKQAQQLLANLRSEIRSKERLVFGVKRSGALPTGSTGIGILVDIPPVDLWAMRRRLTRGMARSRQCDV